MAAYHWRTVRTRLVMQGHSNPLATLPDLHVLLDAVEAMIVEGKANEGSDEVQRFYFSLYKPEVGKAPEGFDEDDQMAGFDALESMLGEMR